MNREAVSSSTIAAVAYDPAREILEVQFRPGKLGTSPVWQYEGVPAHVASEVMEADSIGRAFASQIKAAGYTARRVATVSPEGHEIPIDAVTE